MSEQILLAVLRGERNCLPAGVLCWFVTWELGKGMALAAVGAPQVSVCPLCLQAGQAAPLLPSLLVCKQVGFTQRGCFAVWGPCQQHLRAGRDGVIVKVQGGRGLLEKKCHMVR